MKESGEIVSSAPLYESTRAPLARSPFPDGEGYDTRTALSPTQRLSQGRRQRGGGFAAKKEANPASLRSAAPSKGRGSRGHTLLPMEGGAPKGRRLGEESGMKERGDGERDASHARTALDDACLAGSHGIME